MKSLRAGVMFCLVTILSLGLSFITVSGSQNPAEKSPGTTTSSAAPLKVDAPPTGMEAFQGGLKLFKEQKFVSAAANFEIAANTQATALLKSHAYAWLARTELHLHNLDEAEAAAQKALENARDSSNAQSAMAEIYFRQGKIPESQQLLIPLVKAQTGGARTYLALARISQALGNYKSAYSLVEAAHKMDPKDPDIENAWIYWMTREERLAEWKKKLEEGKFDDNKEKVTMEARIALLEDQQRNQNRACRLVSHVTKTETKLLPLLHDPQHIRGFGLTVKVNNTSASLMLDSGSSGILLSSKIAEKAGIGRVSDIPIWGIGDAGASNGYVGFASNLKIGELEFENCYITVIDTKRALQDDGLIGTNVFENYLVDIEFPDGKMRLSQLPPYPDELQVQPFLNSEQTSSAHLHNSWTPPEFADYEKVYRFDHMMLLPVGLNEAPPHLFLLDTGAFENTVSVAAAKEASKISEDSQVRVKGLSGEVKKVSTTGNVLLTFGHFQQHGNLIAFDMSGISNSVGIEVSGTLGISMLSLLEIKLDYRDNLVQFKYEAPRFH
jgi:tetratricopeptide (TPR) repeat protein